MNQVTDLKRMVDKCAREDKTMGLIDRVERMAIEITRRLSTEHPTIDQVNLRFAELNSN